jgi:hypothetical protein
MFAFNYDLNAIINSREDLVLRSIDCISILEFEMLELRFCMLDETVPDKWIAGNIF